MPIRVPLAELAKFKEDSWPPLHHRVLQCMKHFSGTQLIAAGQGADVSGL